MKRVMNPDRRTPAVPAPGADLRGCPDLPSLPAVARRVLELTGPDARADARAVAHAVSLDPGLASRLLRLVNSSFYGAPRHVGSVHAAVVALGTDAVRSLALGFTLIPALSDARRPAGGFDIVAVWRRGLYAATAARAFAMQVRGVQPEEAFLAALLMDVGVVALRWRHGADYERLVAATADHADLPAAERAALGHDHALMSGRMADAWQFPERLQIPMAHHHDPDLIADRHLRDTTAVVALAARCGSVLADGAPAGALADVRAACARRFGMTELACDAVLCDVAIRTREFARIFDVPLQPLCGLETRLELPTA